MRVTYKIVHPSRVRDWVAANRAAGKNVRMIDVREEGRNGVPVMSVADYENGCVIFAVKEKSRRVRR